MLYVLTFLFSNSFFAILIFYPRQKMFKFKILYLVILDIHEPKTIDTQNTSTTH